MNQSQLHLFDAVGLEMEYMLVDRDTLSIRPVADTLLAILSGGRTASDFESGPITWSNELALHVLEIKTTLPTRNMRSLPSQFETAIHDLRPALDRLNIRLMPTAMHPWMNPAIETIIWPHENFEIYHAYDRIFECKSHGWSNVQSVHLNLPFCGDEEFAKLHAAVRLVLPILPALAASSPVVDGKATGNRCSRLSYYADHCSAVPSLMGDLIPEPIFDEATYRREVFEPMQKDMKPLDPDQVFELDFLNARGAIARFDRGSIELRVMDVQEYPGADVAICAAVTAVVKSLVAERWSSLETQQNLPSALLRSILDLTAKHAEDAAIQNTKYLDALGIRKASRTSSFTAGDLWSALLDQVRQNDTSLRSLYAPIEIIQQHGTLATRISKALGPKFSREDLFSVYDEVSDCLNTWEPFQP